MLGKVIREGEGEYLTESSDEKKTVTGHTEGSDPKTQRSGGQPLEITELGAGREKSVLMF